MNKTTAALKLAEEALNAMLTHMGMDEDEWTKPTFNQAREALDAIREVLSEQEKQEPVAEVHNTDTPSNWSIIKPGLPAGTKLYAAPVCTKDLTDDDIKKAVVYYTSGWLTNARAVIAAFKEKNKCHKN